MSRLMHWLNWYSAMLLKRLLRRRGHSWERRYHAVAVPDCHTRHALYVLRRASVRDQRQVQVLPHRDTSRASAVDPE